MTKNRITILKSTFSSSSTYINYKYSSNSDLFISQSETLWEWDDRFTSKMFGFKDWKEYYTDGHSFKKLPYVDIPMLIINAEDDPLSPADCK